MLSVLMFVARIDGKREASGVKSTHGPRQSEPHAPHRCEGSIEIDAADYPGGAQQNLQPGSCSVNAAAIVRAAREERFLSSTTRNPVGGYGAEPGAKSGPPRVGLPAPGHREAGPEAECQPLPTLRGRQRDIIRASAQLGHPVSMLPRTF